MFITIIVILLVAIIATYPKWSYRQWAHKCEEEVAQFTGRRRQSDGY